MKDDPSQYARDRWARLDRPDRSSTALCFQILNLISKGVKVFSRFLLMYYGFPVSFFHKIKECQLIRRKDSIQVVLPRIRKSDRFMN